MRLAPSSAGRAVTCQQSHCCNSAQAVAPFQYPHLSHRNRRPSDELASREGSAEGNAQLAQAGKASSADDAGPRTSTGGGSAGQGSSHTELGRRAHNSTSVDPAADRDGTPVTGAAVHSAGPHQAAADALLPQAGAGEGAGGSGHRPSCMGQTAAHVAGASIGGTAGACGQVAAVQLAEGHQPGSEGLAAGAGADLTPASGGGQPGDGVEMVWVPGMCCGATCTVQLFPAVKGTTWTV